jgi:tight adherence protein C
MSDLVAILDNPVNAVAGLTALGCFYTVAAMAMPAFRGDKLSTRMKSVANRREELRRRSRQQIREGGALRQVDESVTKKVVDRLQLSKLLEDPKLVDNLAQAGLRGPKPLSTFYLFRFLMPFVLGAAAFTYLFPMHVTHWTIQMRCVVVMGMVVAGYYAPNLYLKNRIAKRMSSIMAVFPDALDLLLICVESGMSIEAAIQKVAAEIGTGSIELAEELSLLTAELSYLPERRLAYEGLARRTAHPGVKSVCTAMIQAERYGTPLGGALRVMAKENRDLRIAAAEKKAAQLPAKLTVPMIVFFLPVLFIVILGPAIMKVQDTQHPHASTPATSPPAR